MLDALIEGQILLADRAYDSDEIRQSLAERGAWANIKPMPNRKNVPAFSAFLYRYRNLVERFFNKACPREGGETFPARLEEVAQKKGVDSSEIEIWFADEARIGQKNKITRRWARRGTRPSAPHDQRTASTYIFGAVCPHEGKGAALVLPACNTEAMSLHLAEIANTVKPGAHAVLLLDQAGWHLSTRLIVPPNITIIALPPKSPELNPMENIWQFVRDNWLSNRIFASYEDILEHCCRAWNRLIEQPLENHVHRAAQMGTWVLISGTWYKTVPNPLFAYERRDRIRRPNLD